jgi:hypothetical protein
MYHQELRLRSWSYLSLLAGEVVGGLESSSDASLDGSIATVIGRQDRVLEAAGVLNVDIELAVLALLSHGNAGADGRDVRIEDQGDDAAVIGELGSHSSLGASGATILNALDGDL